MSLRPVVAIRQLVLVLPAAAAAVETLRHRAQDAERRATAAEQEAAALRSQQSRQALLGGAVLEGGTAQEPDGAPPLLSGGRSAHGGGGRRKSAGLAGDGNCDDAGKELGPPGSSRDAGWEEGRLSKRMKRNPDASSAGAGGSGKEHADGCVAFSYGSNVDEGDGDTDGRFVGSPGAAERSDEDYGGDDPEDEDDDYSPGSGGVSRRGGGGTRRGRRGRGGGGGGGTGQVAGQKRGRGRPRKSAAGTVHHQHGGSTAPPGGANASHAGAASAQPPPPPAPMAAAAAAAGFGDCPVCGSQYALSQLQSHVDMCLVRKGLGGTGSGAAAAAAAPPPPIYGTRGAGAGAAGASHAAAGRAAAGSASAAPAPVGLVGAPAPAAAAALLHGGRTEAAPQVDIQVPPARNWHTMSLKEAKNVMSAAGLPFAKMDKQEMADLYNRYRSFLQTEKDRCNFKTKTQLLAVFLKLDEKATRAKRQPAEVPSSMKALIEQHTARMAVEMEARRRQALARIAAAEQAPEPERAPEQGQAPGQTEEHGPGQGQVLPPASEPAPQGSGRGPWRPDVELGLGQGQGQGPAALPGGQHTGDGFGALVQGPGPALAAAGPPAASLAAELGEGERGSGGALGLMHGSIAASGSAGAAVAALHQQRLPGSAGGGMGPQSVQSTLLGGLLKDVITIDDSEEEDERATPLQRHQQPGDEEGHQQQPEHQHQYQQGPLGQEQTPPQRQRPGEGGQCEGMDVDEASARGSGGDVQDELLGSGSDGSGDDEATAAAPGGCRRAGSGEGGAPGLAACLATPLNGILGVHPGLGPRGQRSITPRGAAAAPGTPIGAAVAATPAMIAAAGNAAVGAPTPPPPAVLWAAEAGGWGSGAGAGGGEPDTAAWRGLLRAPTAPLSAAEGLMDISNGTGGQRPGMAATPGTKGLLLPTPSGADGGTGLYQQQQ
ncbi:hypothetical protein PLESTF_001778700 [Pleodorina starrii]|nr:hypothetical protein PLESTF_001778700 [Pleodorina starrii]